MFIKKITKHVEIAATTAKASDGNSDTVKNLEITSDYTLVYGQSVAKSAGYMRETLKSLYLKSLYNIDIPATNDSAGQSGKEIVFNAESRSDCKSIMDYSATANIPLFRLLKGTESFSGESLQETNNRQTKRADDACRLFFTSFFIL